MCILMINASPKAGKNNSGYFAQELSALLGEDASIVQVRSSKDQLTAEQREHLDKAHTIVLCFPLYVDHIPSHLLMIMQEISALLNAAEQKPCVYALVNCGFYEGIQNELALEVLQNWCVRSGFEWRGGIGIGAGEMLGSIHGVALGIVPKKSLQIALVSLAHSILGQQQHPFVAVEPDFPRFLYKTAGNISFVARAKRNGLARKDLRQHAVEKMDKGKSGPE